MLNVLNTYVFLKARIFNISGQIRFALFKYDNTFKQIGSQFEACFS